MLSKKTIYAIKALAALTKQYSSKTLVPVSEIAESERIPRKFLETILSELRNNGFLHSKKGMNGGYYLSIHPEKIMLSNIIRITGGPIAMLPCVSLHYYESCDECANEAACSLRDIMTEVRDSSLRILSNTSIADLVERESKLIQD